MKNNTVLLDHVNFTVENFRESVEWYHKIFSFELVEKGISEAGNKWGILKNGDSMLAITEYPDKKWGVSEEYHQTYHIGLRLADKQEWEEKIRQYNLETYYGSPITYPHSRSWYVKDPTGHEIEVAIWNNNKVQF